jgi:hypothetical protein
MRRSSFTLTSGTSVTLFAFGLPTQSSTSTPSTTWLVHTATGLDAALGAPVMAKTPTAPAATKNRQVRDRITHVVIRDLRFVWSRWYGSKLRLADPLPTGKFRLPEDLFAYGQVELRERFETRP